VVVPLPKFECPDDIRICSIDKVITLPALPFPKYHYSGTGVFTQGGPFYFSAQKPGKYIISAWVTDKYGCSDSCNFKIIVGEFNLECPPKLWVCADLNNDLFSLWNFDPHGEFSGEWVTSDGIFNAPYIPGKNNCYPIKYKIFIDESCKDSCTFTVCVLPAPKFDCPDSVYLCINDGPYLPKIDLNHKFFWNDKEIPNGFYPAEAGVGTHHVKLVYTANNELKCTYTCEFDIIVVPKPKWECPDDIKLCFANQVFELHALPFPKYQYSGTGVFSKGETFYFSAPKPGKYVIKTTFTDQYGCSDSCSFIIIAEDFKLECPKEVLRVCPDVKTDLTELWNFDPNGEFFGEWVTADGIFNAPYIPGKNNCYTIKYRLIINDNCKDSCRFVVCVYEVPEVRCPDTLEVCLNDKSFNPVPAGTIAIVYLNGSPLPNNLFNPAEVPELTF
jgi:hypothetical protein